MYELLIRIYIVYIFIKMFSLSVGIHSKKKDDVMTIHWTILIVYIRKAIFYYIIIYIIVIYDHKTITWSKRLKNKNIVKWN